jgi:hypothetical protein
MFAELEKADKIVKAENYSEANDTRSGYFAMPPANWMVHSSLFSPKNTNSIFMIVNVKGDINKEKLQSENVTKIINKYIKSEDIKNLNTGLSFDAVDSEFNDNEHWTPTIGDGFITLQENENEKSSLKGVRNHVIMAYINQPLLSMQFRHYLQKFVDNNSITFAEFWESDKHYQKFIDLAKRNAQRLIYNFSVLLGLEVDNVYDQNAFRMENHDLPYMAIPTAHWWINKLEKLDNKTFAYNNNVTYNSRWIDANQDNAMTKIILYREEKLSGRNDCDNIYPFLSGMSNKIIFVCANDGNALGFPFMGIPKTNSKTKSSKYSVSNMKDIEKCFVSQDENFNLEKTEQFTNYEELFEGKQKHKKIYFNHVITKIK